jgi:hypothetical protein
VRGARQDRQPGPADPGHVAHSAAAEEAEHLDGVLGADGVGVPDDDQGGGGDASDVVAGPGEGCLVELLELGEQGREAVGIGGDGPVGRLERRADEHLRGDGWDHRE